MSVQKVSNYSASKRTYYYVNNDHRCNTTGTIVVGQSDPSTIQLLNSQPYTNNNKCIIVNLVLQHVLLTHTAVMSRQAAATETGN